MLKPCFVAGMVAVDLVVLNASLVSGQDYPSKPIRIVTSEAGGGTDFQARIVAQGLIASLGQPVIVDNRPSGLIPPEVVSKAPPDGYTLLVSPDALWIRPLLQKAPYDAVRDFSPISSLASAPNILVVHPSLPVKSVKELIGLAKAKPGALNCAVAALGGSSHLAVELFKVMAGVKILHIPYRGGGSAVNAVLGGEAQLMFPTAGAVTTHIRSGRLRAVAVTSAKPSALFPNLPTVAVSGLPGYQSESIVGIYAPAKTPATIINRLNQEVIKLINRPDVKEKFFNGGVEVGDSSPEELAATMKSDITKWGKLIKDADIKMD